MIEIKNVAKWFGEVVALSGVTATISSGLTALLGPNGAGKSSLIRIICGMTSPSQGTVRVLGFNPRTDGALRKILGLVPQQEKLPPGVNAQEFVAMAGSLQGLADPNAAARRAIQTVELDPDDHRHLSSYSKGMRQRVKIAQALVHDPKILILDDALASVDTYTEERILSGLKRNMEGRTTVFISHRISTARNADQIAVLVAGRIAELGTHDELIARNGYYTSLFEKQRLEEELAVAT